MGTEALTTVETALARLPQWLEADDHLRYRGRFLSCEMLVEADQAPFYLSVRSGRLEEVTRGPCLMRSFTFALKASAAAWLSHWQPVPKPGFHDVFAMSKAGELRIEGDLQPFVANLQYVKDLLALPRNRIGVPA